MSTLSALGPPARAVAASVARGPIEAPRAASPARLLPAGRHSFAVPVAVLAVLAISARGTGAAEGAVLPNLGGLAARECDEAAPPLVTVFAGLACSPREADLAVFPVVDGRAASPSRLRTPIGGLTGAVITAAAEGADGAVIQSLSAAGRETLGPPVSGCVLTRVACGAVGADGAIFPLRLGPARVPGVLVPVRRLVFAEVASGADAAPAAVLPLIGLLPASSECLRPPVAVTVSTDPACRPHTTKRAVVPGSCLPPTRGERLTVPIAPPVGALIASGADAADNAISNYLFRATGGHEMLGPPTWLVHAKVARGAQVAVSAVAVFAVLDEEADLIEKSEPIGNHLLNESR